MFQGIMGPMAVRAEGSREGPRGLEATVCGQSASWPRGRCGTGQT